MADTGDTPAATGRGAITVPAPTPAPAWFPPFGGACRPEDRATFFGFDGEPAVAALAREEDAKRVCARCAVLLECRAAALADPDGTGVRGGLTPVERAAVRHRRGRRVIRGRSRATSN